MNNICSYTCAVTLEDKYTNTKRGKSFYKKLLESMWTYEDIGLNSYVLVKGIFIWVVRVVVR